MADFIQLPVVTDLRVSDNGSPFKDSAWLFANASGGQGMYIATDNGTVYAARVGSILYIVCIGFGYFAYTWFAGTNFTRKWEVEKTVWSSIYTVATLTVTGNWIADLTEFETEAEMLERFYDTIVFPGVTPLSGDIMVLLNPKIGYDTINVDLPISIAGADTIIVSGKPNTIDSNNSGGISQPTVSPEGTFDDSSDPIPIPPIPTVSAANSGLITLFRPTLSELHDLGEYLWTNILDFIENMRRLFSNPMDYFIAFHIVPCLPEVGIARTIKLGLWDSGVSMSPIISQWYEHEFGSIVVNPYWGSALDYAPYTKITLFLPFIGSVSLNTDEIMGNTLALKYRVDLLSGQCVALLSVNGDCIYQFTGECAVSIPLTGADWSRIYSAAIGATTAIVAGVAGVAGAAPTGVGMGRTTADLTQSVSAAGDAFANVNSTSKGVSGVAAMREQLLQAAERANNASATIANNAVRRSSALRATAISAGVNNVAGNIMSAKPNVQHASSISGSAGILGIRKPYLLIEYPNQSLADNYKHFVGYPSNIYAKLSSLTGYTECESVILSGINATEDEIAEISSALKTGVYL